jgi:hypothetical protein
MFLNCHMGVFLCRYKVSFLQYKMNQLITHLQNIQPRSHNKLPTTLHLLQRICTNSDLANLRTWVFQSSLLNLML